jgi:hypothetical protein
MGLMTVLQELLAPDIGGGPAVFRHFALTNAAKCSRHGTGNEVPGRCYENCARYVVPELEILKPDIVVSTGSGARVALEDVATPLPPALVDRLTNGVADSMASRNLIEKHVRMVVLPDNRTATWLRLRHPARGIGVSDGELRMLARAVRQALDMNRLRSVG